MEESLNVFDEPLVPCGTDPVTGFFRDGCCNTGDEDLGSHTVCIQVTKDFLEYSRFRGIIQSSQRRSYHRFAQLDLTIHGRGAVL